MSEINIHARNKFIEKVQKKVTDLTKSIDLLYQVDKKLFMNQSGGVGSLHLLGVNMASLEARANAFKTAMANAAGLSSTLTNLGNTIETYQSKLDTILDALDFDKNIDKIDPYTILSSSEYAALLKILEQATLIEALPSDSSMFHTIKDLHDKYVKLIDDIKKGTKRDGNPSFTIDEQSAIEDYIKKRLNQGLHDTSKIIMEGIQKALENNKILSALNIIEIINKRIDKTKLKTLDQSKFDEFITKINSFKTYNLVEKYLFDELTKLTVDQKRLINFIILRERLSEKYAKMKTDATSTKPETVASSNTELQIYMLSIYTELTTNMKDAHNMDTDKILKPHEALIVILLI